MDQDKRISLKALADTLFSPRTPITTKDLFSGRSEQISRIISAVRQPGAHAVIFGERGVGKTSLANCINAFLSVVEPNNSPILAPVINCDSSDTYASLWRKVFSEVSISNTRVTMGFRPDEEQEARTMGEALADTIAPLDVKNLLNNCGKQCRTIVILDEFDRVPPGMVTRLMADTIKMMADQIVPATIILVGVGDSISQLIQGHESIGRHLIEVPMPRMSKPELDGIVNDRLPPLGMTITQYALDALCLLSRGLPYHMHLLGQNAVHAALDADSLEIGRPHLSDAINGALNRSEHAMKTVYYEATRSAQKNYLAQYLAACALAQKDQFGYFTAASLREPMSRIMGKEYPISSFNSRLEEFCNEQRAKILTRSGRERNWRYRFRDPLMEPFVVISSLAGDVIKFEALLAATKPK